LAGCDGLYLDVKVIILDRIAIEMSLLFVFGRSFMAILTITLVFVINSRQQGIAREPSLPKTLKINGHLRWLFGLFFLILHVGTYKE